ECPPERHEAGRNLAVFGSPMRITRMQDQECRDTLARLAFGRLGCARENQPYIVPIYFAYEVECLYGFATSGQKIEWMRTNPRVCIQSDEVLGNDNWTSVVVLGRYEELPLPAGSTASPILSQHSKRMLAQDWRSGRTGRQRKTGRPS